MGLTQAEVHLVAGINALPSPPRWLRQMLSKVQLVYRLFCRLRARDVIAFLKARRYRSGIQRTFELGAKSLKHPISVRAGTSDLAVFRQLILGEEYDCLLSIRNLELVIDCGANIGISAAWFLSRYPACSVVSLEPDPDNFACLARNLKPYGDRWSGHLAALWDKSNEVLEVHSDYRDGREWSRAVRPACHESQALVETLTLSDIIAMHSGRRVSLLKIDIEGAELNIFQSSVDGWIDKVDRILIELHDEACEQAFQRAIPDSLWRKTRAGDLVLCERLA